MKFQRPINPPRWRWGLSRKFPWLLYRETDYQVAFNLTGRVNSREWRGAQPRSVLVTGGRIDKDVTFTVDHGQHDLRILDGRQVRTFQVYAATDFNRIDFGEPVVPEWIKRWAEQFDESLALAV